MGGIPDLVDTPLPERLEGKNSGALIEAVARFVSKHICIMPLRYRLHDFLADGEPGDEWIVAGGVVVRLENGTSFKAGADGLIFMTMRRPVASRKVHIVRPPDANLDKFFEREGKKGLPKNGQIANDILLSQLPKAVLGH